MFLTSFAKKARPTLAAASLAALAASGFATGAAEQSSAAAQTAQATLGRNLAATCANCHGTNGRAKGEVIRPLAGRPADTTVALMGAYKSGAISGTTIMHQIAKGYSDEQIRLIAAYFAAQQP